MRSLLIMLALLIAIPMHAEVSPTAQVFFEPTQQDYDCCAGAIKLQHRAYHEAKVAGNYQDAVANALFYWTRAWVHFNKAMTNVATEKDWNSVESLTASLGYLDKAETDATASKHEQAGKIKALVAKNRATFQTQIDNLNKKK